MIYIKATLICLLILNSLNVNAEVYKVEISSREIILSGNEFGNHGTYELLKGNIFFRFDPNNPSNRKITDISLAEKNDQGLVEAWSNLVVLKPVNQNKSRGVALVEVSNRGGKFTLSYFNRATSSGLIPFRPGDWGDGLLMEMGLTLIWIGWQFDVPDHKEILKLRVPIAKNTDGSSIKGLVRSDWTLDHPTKQLGLGHQKHIPYPVSDPDDSANVLTVRNGRDTPKTIIQRNKWRFARVDKNKKSVDGLTPVVDDPNYINKENGFEEGKIYELVYRAQNPPVVGLGLAAIRDVISYAKYDDNSPFPVKLGIAAGVSQTGRFIRHFLYQGFNRDEHDRKAYDGLMVITAGAGRGSFNHRFAQPSRDAHRYSAFFYPTDIFPFTSKVITNPVTAKSDGLLSHLDNKYWPKIFYINTGYEYWGRAASLIHSSFYEDKDIKPFKNERIYHLASGQHFVGRFPPTPRTALKDKRFYRGNPLNFSVNYRALLAALVYWVKDDIQPPESAYPKIEDGTLVNFKETGFPEIPGLDYPTTIHTVYITNYGPRWERGIVDIQPPELIQEFIPKVSKVDFCGNEIAGIRNVEILVPLATYTPWSLRTGFAGESHELADFEGTYIPFPKTELEKNISNDPRPSIESLYHSKEDFLKKVSNAADMLINRGDVLSRDKTYLIDNAKQYWAWIHK